MRVGLLGAGHIARALAEGWSRPGAGPGRPGALHFFDLVPGRADALAADTFGVALDGPAEVVAASDLVIVAVRPPDVEGVLAEVAPLLGERCLVSVAAGVPLERLVAALPPGARVGRVMPNVAAAVGLGVFLLVAGNLGSGAAGVREVFASEGTVVEVDEGLFDVATAIASCMPGVLAHLAEALAEGGMAGGLDETTARDLAVAAIHGAAAVIAREGDPAAVAAAAATPGGMTAAAIQTLDQRDVPAALTGAVAAAAARARELA